VGRVLAARRLTLLWCWQCPLVQGRSTGNVTKAQEAKQAKQAKPPPASSSSGAT
jgi:hypothetical protein